MSKYLSILGVKMILLFNSSVLFSGLCWWTKWLYKTTTILLTTGLNVLILIRNINLNNYFSKLKLALKFLVPNIKLVDIDPTNLAYTNSNIDTLHKKMYPPTFLHHSCLSTCAEIGMRHAFWIKNVNNHYTPYCLNYNATHTQIIDLQKSYWNFFLRA